MCVYPEVLLLPFPLLSLAHLLPFSLLAFLLLPLCLHLRMRLRLLLPHHLHLPLLRRPPLPPLLISHLLLPHLPLALLLLLLLLLGLLCVPLLPLSLLHRLPLSLLPISPYRPRRVVHARVAAPSVPLPVHRPRPLHPAFPFSFPFSFALSFALALLAERSGVQAGSRKEMRHAILPPPSRGH